MEEGGVSEKGEKYIASLSGGKDSTAMVLRLLEEGWPLDEIVFCDTGMEFPQMYEHLDRLERVIGRPITRLKAPESFEYYFYESTPLRKNPNLVGKQGKSWPDPMHRWCTGMMKTRIIDSYLKSQYGHQQFIQYVGIAADEPERVKGQRYPLVEWGMTEADCLQYCRDRGFDWGGLYDIFQRVSCWCCPLQSLDSLRNLRLYFPDLWQKLLYMDGHTWRQFRKDYSVRQLDRRFAFEEQCIKNGLPITGRPFYDALRKHLNQQKGGDAR